MKIAFLSQPEYFRFMYENDLDSLGQVKEFPFKFGMDVSEFRELISFEADINFFFRGEFVPNEILDDIKGIKVALSSEPFPRYIHNKLDYTYDSVCRYDTFRSIRNKPYDYVFHYDESSLSFLKKDGLSLSGHFPFPVARQSYFPVEKPSIARDIFFIGRSTRHREVYFGPLKHHFNFLHICHGIWGPELNDLFNESKICLNVHAEDETSWEPRLQLMLSSGAFVISEKITPNKILTPGKDYIEVSSPSEMYEAVEHYLHHEDERKEIVNNAQETIESKLGARTCFEKLVSDVHDQKLERFSSTNGRTALNMFNHALRLKSLVR